MDMRTPLGKVRGLGSAKDGTEHFWRQRLTSVAIRAPTGSAISGPKASSFAGLPSACTTSSGRDSGELRCTTRMRGRPEKEFSSGARR